MDADLEKARLTVEYLTGIVNKQEIQINDLKVECHRRKQIDRSNAQLRSENKWLRKTDHVEENKELLERIKQLQVEIAELQRLRNQNNLLAEIDEHKKEVKRILEVIDREAKRYDWLLKVSLADSKRSKEKIAKLEQQVRIID